MKHIFCMLWLFAIGGLVFLTTPCRAEKPMYDQPVITLSGGIIAPAAPQEKIRMDLMQVNICMQTGSYIIDAVFHLFNTGETTTLWVGFPKHGKAVYQSDNVPLIHDFISFNARVDGRAEEFAEKHSFLHGSNRPFPEPRRIGPSEVTKWMAKKIIFPENAVTTIRVRFEASYDDDEKFRSVPGDSGLFFFGPGQNWKGKIGKAEIVLINPKSDNKQRLLAFDVPRTTLKKHITTENGQIKYEFRELMPNSNGYVRFIQRFYPIEKK